MPKRLKELALGALIVVALIGMLFAAIGVLSFLRDVSCNRLDAARVEQASAYGPLIWPRPTRVPTANSSGSAGTTMPRMMSASQKAIRKITTPAAMGWAAIHAVALSSQAESIGGL